MTQFVFFEKDWSLFLDRDGVLNHRPAGDFVKEPGEFRWNKGALDFLAYCASRFGVITVITNQQAVGQNLMSEQQLQLIHSRMLQEAKAAGGRIDKVYFCPDLKDSGSFTRKPAVGMALWAKRDFQGINFRKSVMIGDTFTDMLFGKRLKMKTILISSDTSVAGKYPQLVDWWFPDMEALLQFLKNSETPG